MQGRYTPHNRGALLIAFIYSFVLSPLTFNAAFGHLKFVEILFLCTIHYFKYPKRGIFDSFCDHKEQE